MGWLTAVKHPPDFGVTETTNVTTPVLNSVEQDDKMGILMS